MIIRARSKATVGIGLLLALSVVLMGGSSGAGKILGCADSFAVLGATGVSNSGPTRIYGNLGVQPGAAISGFPPGVVFKGLIYPPGDAVAVEAQAAAFSAYNRLRRLPSVPLAAALEGNLGGLRLLPGVYSVDTAARLNGILRLDARGADNALFVFQLASSLTTAQRSAVFLLNRGHGAQVYWQVSGSATLGRHTTFVGNILAHDDIVLIGHAKILCGQAFSLAGGVVMDRNYISPACEAEEPISPVVGGFLARRLKGNMIGPLPPNQPGEPPEFSSPEPGTFWLAGICVALLIAWGVRRSPNPANPRGHRTTADPD
jgi:type VI secretion system secreted protein VgrG